MSKATVHVSFNQDIPTEVAHNIRATDPIARPQYLHGVPLHKEAVDRFNKRVTPTTEMINIGRDHQNTVTNSSLSALAEMVHLRPY